MSARSQARNRANTQTFWGRARRSGTLISGATLLAIIVAAAIAAPWIAPHSPTAQNLTGGLLPPSPEHWFGTDQLGRDVFSRVLYAARTDLAIAFVAALLPFVVGVTAGLISGYFGRQADWVISRVVDTVIAFPFYVIVIAIAFALGAGPAGIVVAFALVGWVGYARVIRLLTASMRREEWVRSARGAGLSHPRVLVRHVLPNVLPQAVVLFMNEVLLIMVAIVTLGYLGLGMQPPTPDWGTMIAEAQPFVTTKGWLAALPGLAVVITGVGLSLTADGLGDALRVREAGGRAGSVRNPHGAGSSPRVVQPLAMGAVLVDKLVVGVAPPRGTREAKPETDPTGAGQGEHGNGNCNGSGNDSALVRGVSFTVEPGGALGIVGESGSGKSLTLRALLGLMPAGVSKSGGIAEVGGRVGMVFQDPLTALDPLTRVGTQLGEAVGVAERSQGSLGRAGRNARVRELLDLVQLPEDRIARSYPHELSGGQRQRIVIAMALASNPSVLLCDEPTTALDVTVQREMLELLRQLRSTRGLTLVFVSHDLAVVSSMCDRIIVMRGGAIVEAGKTPRVLNMPESAYTRRLLDAVPQLPPLAGSGAANDMVLADAGDPSDSPDPTAATASTTRNALEACGVTISYSRGLPAVSGVSFEVASGGALGIVGESGSGKTTLARALVGQLALSSGTLRLDGELLSAKRPRALLSAVQLVPQDPTSSLNPRMRVGDALTEVLRLTARASRNRRVTNGPGTNTTESQQPTTRELLTRVQLDPDLAGRYPHELSGGQRQRVAIARALATNPRVLVADEPTSALDVSIQAEIVALLKRLRVELGLTLVFISHDLAVVHELCDAVLVMRAGRVEEAGGPEFFTRPTSPYGRQLVAAVPRLEIDLRSPDPR